MAETVEHARDARDDPAESEPCRSAVDRAQLRLALAATAYISGDAARSREQAEAVLAQPGLPDALYDAARQRLVLALLEADEDRSPAPEAGSRNAGGVSTPMMALAALAWRDGRIAETLRLLWASVRCASLRDGVRHCYPTLGLSVVFTALGEHDDARASVLTAADEISFGGDAMWTAAPAVFAAHADLAAGRMEDARSSAQAGLDLAVELATPMMSPRAREVLVHVALRRGELADASAHLDAWRAEPRIGGVPFGTAHLQWAAMRLRDARGVNLLDDRTSEAAFDLVAEDRSLLLEDPAAAAWLARAARRDGDMSRVRSIVRSANRLVRLNPGHPSISSAADHAAGVADRDLTRLAAAADGHRAPWARASAAEDAALVCVEAGDRRAARTWLDRAAGDYGNCGAERDSARIRARLRDLGVRVGHWSRQQRPVSGWASLTETEKAVASLVAEGLSNQQVAARMFLSRHTVDFHLRHIFRKLGIDSRVVLARLALLNESGAA
jgi:DNA-binding CsgD family transcriptional regulator